jgi:hypothetical protein
MTGRIMCDVPILRHNREFACPLDAVYQVVSASDQAYPCRGHLARGVDRVLASDHDYVVKVDYI